MAIKNTATRTTDGLRLFRLYLCLLGTFTLFWWPLSHWLYPDWYHHLFGFARYDYSLVKIIGTLGVMPVMGMFLVARDPRRNRDMMIMLLVVFTLLAATDLFLITTHGFPRREWFNVVLLSVNSLILARFYPWTTARRT